MRSRTAGLFSAWRPCCPPNARNRAPRTEPGLTTAAPKANTRECYRCEDHDHEHKRRHSFLHLDPDNLPDDKIANGLQRDSSDHQSVADRIGK